MSTKLTSDVVRETSTMADGRELVVSLNEDQTILMKRKGMKSGFVSIPIIDLWNYLSGTKSIVPIKKHTINSEDTLISLQRLRTLNSTTPGKIEVLARVDELIVDLMEENKTL